MYFGLLALLLPEYAALLCTSSLNHSLVARVSSQFGYVPDACSVTGCPNDCDRITLQDYPSSVFFEVAGVY